MKMSCVEMNGLRWNSIRRCNVKMNSMKMSGVKWNGMKMSSVRMSITEKPKRAISSNVLCGSSV